jgi:uncharacterized protein (DUF305 family)
MFKKILLLITAISLSFFVQPALANSHAKSLKNLGMNEIMFAQAMIPHHQQAIDMAKMALKNGASPEVSKLAKEIIAVQGKEISQIKYWLTATKSSMTMGHDMGMGGMLSNSELMALNKLKGRWSTCLIAQKIARPKRLLSIFELGNQLRSHS